MKIVYRIKEFIGNILCCINTCSFVNMTYITFDLFKIEKQTKRIHKLFVIIDFFYSKCFELIFKQIQTRQLASKYLKYSFFIDITR